MNILIIIAFFSVHVCSSEIIDTNINVCNDAERLDFEKSCTTHNQECIEDISYLKGFQYFQDFYIHYKNNIYHTMDDVIYFQKCERTKKISIPRTVTECSKYIPVTFIANDGQNRSGLLSQYEVIRPVTVDKSKRHVDNKCSTDRLLFSLPNSLKNLVRIGTSLETIHLPKKAKAYEVVKELANSLFTNYLEKNTIIEIIFDLFAPILFLVFVIVAFFCMICLCCCNICCKKNYGHLFLKQCITEANNLESIKAKTNTQTEDSGDTATQSQRLAYSPNKNNRQSLYKHESPSKTIQVHTVAEVIKTNKLNIQKNAKVQSQGIKLYWELFRKCKDLKLNTNGNIEALQQRLKEYYS
jgi:hypothetical protein